MSETTVVLTIIGGIAAPLLTYLGVRYTARSAGEVNRADQAGEERREVMDAWRALLEPYRERADKLEERADKLEEKNDALEKKVDHQAVELRKQARQISGLISEVRRWQRIAHTIARWAMVLRDELLRLDVDVPAAPEELVELQALGQDRAPWVTPPTD